MSIRSQTKPDVILFYKTRSLCQGGKTPQKFSDAARSWGGSALLGVPPMSDCRGFPHERLHQDKVLWQQPILHHCRLHFAWHLRRLHRAPLANLCIAKYIEGVHAINYCFTRAFESVLNRVFFEVWVKFC